MRKNLFTTKDIVTIAMFTALTAILSQILIPLPFSPIPVNLATLSIFLAGGLLTPIKATTSQIIFLLLGLVGLPVFAGFGSGIGTLIGPTGGYIIGFVFSALVISYLKIISPNKIWAYATIMGIGLLICYAIGTLWFMYITNNSFVVSLSLCVFPFLPADFIKILIAATLVSKLEKHIS